MAPLNQTAPDFTLINTDKEQVKLSDHRGKKIVLAFYPAAFSGICDQEMCIFEERLDQLNNAQTLVFGISPDSPFANAKFAEVNNISFPLLSDLHLQAARDYGVEFENFASLMDIPLVTGPCSSLEKMEALFMNGSPSIRV